MLPLVLGGSTAERTLAQLSANVGARMDELAAQVRGLRTSNADGGLRLAAIEARLSALEDATFRARRPAEPFRELDARSGWQVISNLEDRCRALERAGRSASSVFAP